MDMLGAVGIHLLQWLLAFLALDLFFRMIPLEPAGLRERVRAYRTRFGLLATAFTLAGALAQGWLAGGWGLAVGLLGWLPWWILWRFGWRKQLTFLYKDDGGRAIIGAKRPDPS